jgi:hypothetical protein
VATSPRGASRECGEGIANPLISPPPHSYHALLVG